MEEKDVDEVKGYILKGKRFDDVGLYEDALKAYDEALRIRPDDEKVWVRKGLILCYMKKYHEALNALDEAIKLKPNFASAWASKGLTVKIDIFNGSKDDKTRLINPHCCHDLPSENGSKRFKIFCSTFCRHLYQLTPLPMKRRLYTRERCRYIVFSYI